MKIPRLVIAFLHAFRISTNAPLSAATHRLPEKHIFDTNARYHPKCRRGEARPDEQNGGKYEKGIYSAVIAPAKLNTRINGVNVSIECITDYPFKNKVTYVLKAEEKTRFTFGIRIPLCVERATVEGKAVEMGAMHEITREDLMTCSACGTDLCFLHFQSRKSGLVTSIQETMLKESIHIAIMRSFHVQNGTMPLPARISR